MKNKFIITGYFFMFIILGLIVIQLHFNFIAYNSRTQFFEIVSKYYFLNKELSEQPEIKSSKFNILIGDTFGIKSLFYKKLNQNKIINNFIITGKNKIIYTYKKNRLKISKKLLKSKIFFITHNNKNYILLNVKIQNLFKEYIGNLIMVIDLKNISYKSESSLYEFNLSNKDDFFYKINFSGFYLIFIKNVVLFKNGLSVAVKFKIPLIFVLLYFMIGGLIYYFIFKVRLKIIKYRKKTYYSGGKGIISLKTISEDIQDIARDTIGKIITVIDKEKSEDEDNNDDSKIDISKIKLPPGKKTALIGTDSKRKIVYNKVFSDKYIELNLKDFERTEEEKKEDEKNKKFSKGKAQLIKGQKVKIIFNKKRKNYIDLPDEIINTEG